MSNSTVTYSQVNETAADFLANVTYDVLKPEESFICDYMQRETDYDKAKPSGIKVFLPAGELSVRDGYTNITYRETVEEGDYKFVNLTPGAVSEYTVTSGGKTVASGTLKPTGAIRMIDCGDTVFNVRDLGGWKCDGGSIKYGKLFRGGAFEEPKEARKILVDRCGIRAELNLRGIEVCPGNVSVLGEDILYCRPENCQFYTTSDSEIWREILRFVFDCVKGGNPLYFHCQCGADRTGTCACILEAILGVSNSDIDKDYELTNFAPDSSGRLRNYRDTWGGLMYEIYSELPCGVSLRDRVIRWVASLGFTEDEINDFRRSMTDGNPETIRLDELDKFEKTEYDQMNPVASGFLRDVEYDPAEHDTTRIIEYAERKTDYRKDHPVGVTVHTDGGFLKVHDRYDNRWYGEEVPAGDVRIVNLTPGVDSEYTVEREGKIVQYGVLHPTGSLRMIDCGDAVINVRDLGGWKCDGGRIKYGKIYRGAALEKPEQAREILVDRLGIRAELNLKGINESPESVSRIGEDILYCRPENCQWYTISDSEIWREILRFIFDCVKGGIPLYFHCQSGADRTGTCACVLEAILGLSLSDIEKDYELTNLAFEQHTRLRTMRGEFNWWEWLLNEVSGLPGKSFSERIINWVASLGFTEDEINDFRRSMTDGNPETIRLDELDKIEKTEYDQMNPVASEFLRDVEYDPAEHDTTRIIEYAERKTDYRKDHPVGVTVHTDGGFLKVHDRYDNRWHGEEVPAGDVRIVNLTPGVDSEYTVEREGKIVQYGVLHPTGSLRMIDCGDAVENVRDLGGWKCDGGSVKYGKIYRGGNFDKPEEARKVLVDRCGIKAELNLKGIEESPYNVSLLGEDILYCRPENCQWYTIGDAEIWREILRFVFDCVKDGKPLYFHCHSGADRTGTCACVLEAILGVSNSDIDKDYELTNFASDSSGRHRYCSDMWGRLMREIYSELPCGASLRDRVIRWVASLGFTEDEINDFRRSMTDGNPETIRLDELDKIEKTEYDQMNPVASEFLRDVEYDPAEHDTTRIIEYAERKTDYRKDHPVGVTVHTDGGFLKVHDRYDNRWHGEEVPAGDVRIVNLTPGVDSEYTVEREGKIAQYGVLHPTGSLRMIDCGDAVINVRDLGGWKCDGGRIKYGKIYRGGAFEKPEQAREILVDRLGIRAELNLKGINESPESVSRIGEDILYCRPENCQWYTIGDAEIWREILRFVFDCVKDGKPLYFHCHSGADRTGTCACVLEAILGLSLSDIEKDYELTNLAFEQHTRLRTMRGEYNWEWLLNEVSKLPGNSFSERIINWVAGIGFTEDEINEFRRIMIDGTPEPVVITKIN